MENVNKKILQTVFSSYKKKKVNAVIIFGSRARGDFNKDSDYDIAVFLRCKEDYPRSKNLSIHEESIYVDCIDKYQFNHYMKVGHSFLCP